MRATTLMIVTFTSSVALSLVAATTRFGDSAHAMGMISDRGGTARHPVHLPADGNRYTLVVTATVLPPYHGDAKVAVEGPAWADVSVRASGPVLDLFPGRAPTFEDATFHGLEPGDRLALWLLIRKPPVDPVCGHLRTAESIPFEHAGETTWFCSERCRQRHLFAPEATSPAQPFEGTYGIVFRDPESGKELLRIPLILGAGGEGGQGHGH